MKTITQQSIDSVRAGMVLGYDLLDPMGNSLLLKGTELTGDIIARLIRRGVTVVPVLYEEELTSEQIAAQHSAVQVALEHRFRQMDKVDVMQRLKNILLDYRLEGLE